MKRWLVKLSIVVVIGSFLLVNGWILIKHKDSSDFSIPITDVIYPRQMDLKKTLEAEGIVVPTHSYDVYFNQSVGEDYTLLVEEGAIVKKGDPILRYENIEVQATIESLEKQKKELESTLSELEREITQLESVPVSNAMSLDNENVLVDALKHIETNSMLTQKLIEKQQVTSQIHQINQQLEKNRLIEESLVVKSELDGTISDLLTGKAKDGDKLLSIRTSDLLRIEGKLSEMEIPKVKEGMEATATFYALGGKSFEGTLSKINPIPQIKDEKSFYTVYVDLSEVDDRIYEGFHSDLNIFLEQKLGVLALPIDSIQSSKEKTSVFVIENGEVKETSIQVGLQESNYIEIVSGLQEGSKVISHPTGRLENGREFFMPIQVEYLQPEKLEILNREEVARLVAKGLFND